MRRGVRLVRLHSVGDVMSEDLTCYKCGILFGVPNHWVKTRREDKDWFYCPNGHQQHFTKSVTDDLAEKLSRAKQQLAEKDDDLRRQREFREAAERRTAAARGQVTKLKKRASAGVCPCCNRSFRELTLHMSQKHPHFLTEDFENVIPLNTKKEGR
jgi:hypothetical protein